MNQSTPIQSEVQMMKRLWRSPWPATCVILALTGAVFAQNKDDAKGKDKPAASSGTPTKARINDVIRDIAKEAKDSLAETKDWPRKASDYAQKNNLEMDSDDVLTALGRNLDRSDAIDGYIKWQLLSFNPNFAEAAGREWSGIVRGLPQLTPRAQPNATTRRAFTVAEKQPNERLSDKLREMIGEFETEVKQVDQLNMPAIKYRDAVMAQVPDEGGTRMQVRIMDIEHRHAAGSDSHAAAVKALLADAKRLKDDMKTLPAGARQQIIEQVKRLRTLKNPMVNDVSLMASGEVKIVTFPAVFRGRDYDTLMENLGADDGKKK